MHIQSSITTDLNVSGPFSIPLELVVNLTR
jgi:hypothetical protein